MTHAKRTLKLDATFRPVGVIKWQHAICLTLLEKARVIETYDTLIRSPSTQIYMPSVICLNRYVKYRSHNIKCTRVNIFWRDSHRCQYCSGSFIPDFLTMDHVIPKSRGGKKTWSNIVTACKLCNQSKKNRTPEEADMKLIRKPVRPTISDALRILRHDIRPEWEQYLVKF